jgi:hypothetical protein
MVEMDAKQETSTNQAAATVDQTARRYISENKLFINTAVRACLSLMITFSGLPSDAYLRDDAAQNHHKGCTSGSTEPGSSLRSQMALPPLHSKATELLPVARLRNSLGSETLLGGRTLTPNPIQFILKSVSFLYFTHSSS